MRYTRSIMNKINQIFGKELNRLGYLYPMGDMFLPLKKRKSPSGPMGDEEDPNRPPEPKRRDPHKEPSKKLPPDPDGPRKKQLLREIRYAA